MSAVLPDPAALEEASAAAAGDWAAVLGFVIERTLTAAEGRGDERPLLMAGTGAFWRERGRLFGWGARRLGVGHDRLILTRTAREAETLWALEEALKSGAACAALGALTAPSLVATRRLDFAARAGGSNAWVLRDAPPGDLSAARLRWRIAAAPSAAHPLDPRAPGPARLRAELVRSRTGVPGAWIMEQDDETGRFRLAAGLADHGLAASPDGPRRAA